MSKWLTPKTSGRKLNVDEKHHISPWCRTRNKRKFVTITLPFVLLQGNFCFTGENRKEIPQKKKNRKCKQTFLVIYFGDAGSPFIGTNTRSSTRMKKGQLEFISMSLKYQFIHLREINHFQTSWMSPLPPVRKHSSSGWSKFFTLHPLCRHLTRVRWLLT